VELLEAGFQLIVLDNLSNSSRQSLKRVEQITGKELTFYQMDLTDKPLVTTLFKSHDIDAVIHLAGLKSVSESCEIPLKYYQNNINSTLVLLELMAQFSVNKLVFSSSATVYGEPDRMPVDESFPLSATNPYGRTKLMIEEIIRDVCQVTALDAVLLRYFNPAGAHESGLIGEDPNGIPNNLLPYVAQVAAGKHQQVLVFGDDYPTKDGTGIRDYIHVMDLAKGHLKALQAMDDDLKEARGQCRVFNLGTGKGYSVLDVIKGFEKASGQQINYQVVARRSGDVAECYADVSLANEQLDWRAEKSLAQMLEDAWRWQSNNPEGYTND
jgi:UDP-glucose 4-epimerase